MLEIITLLDDFHMRQLARSSAMRNVCVHEGGALALAQFVNDYNAGIAGKVMRMRRDARLILPISVDETLFLRAGRVAAGESMVAEDVLFTAVRHLITIDQIALQEESRREVAAESERAALEAQFRLPSNGDE